MHTKQTLSNLFFCRATMGICDAAAEELQRYSLQDIEMRLLRKRFRLVNTKPGEGDMCNCRGNYSKQSTQARGRRWGTVPMGQG